MKKLPYFIYGVLILGIIGLLCYEIFINGTTEFGELSKPILILAGAVLSVVRFSTRSHGNVRNKKKTYQTAYQEFIRSAFSQDPKLEKKLYSAIDDFYQNKLASALEKLEQLLPECTCSDDRYAVACFTALCYDGMELYNQAIEQYRIALSIRHNSTMASNMGICLDRIGNRSGAIESYKTAIQIDPKNAYPWNNLAQIYLQQAEYEKAVEAGLRAVELNAKMKSAYSALAVSYAMLGDDENHDKYFRLAVANGANGQQIRAYIENLYE